MAAKLLLIILNILANGAKKRGKTRKGRIHEPGKGCGKLRKGWNWRRRHREGGAKGKSSIKREQKKIGRTQNKAGGGGGLHLGIGGFDR